MDTWASRIRDLRGTGLTLAEIGEKTGLSTSAVSDIAQGHTNAPGGDAAVTLYQLHQQICGKKRA